MKWNRGVLSWFSRNATGFDLLFVVVSVPFFASAYWSFTDSSMGTTAGVPLIWLGFDGFLLITAACAFRRARPDLAFWVGLAGALLYLPMSLRFDYTLIAGLYILLIVSSSASLGSRLVHRGALWAVVLGCLAQLLGRYGLRGTDTGFEVWNILSWSVLALALGIGFWALGDAARSRRITMETAQDRIRRLETEAAQERELAAQDERARIAREMHDIVAHSLAVIVTQADGGRYAAAADPAAATRTLEVVASTARESLAQMRSLLGVLRTSEQTAYSAAPDLDSLPDLVETAALSGLDVELSVRGTPRRDDLAPGAELVLYRAAQEMITNVLKHAGDGAQARLELLWSPLRVQLTCRDAQSTARTTTSLPGAGQGLKGMAERVALYGGTARWERLEPSSTREGTAPGGFAVVVSLPYADSHESNLA